MKFLRKNILFHLLISLFSQVRSFPNQFMPPPVKWLQQLELACRATEWLHFIFLPYTRSVWTLGHRLRFQLIFRAFSLICARNGALLSNLEMCEGRPVIFPFLYDPFLSYWTLWVPRTLWVQAGCLGLWADEVGSPIHL